MLKPFIGRNTKVNQYVLLILFIFNANDITVIFLQTKITLTYYIIRIPAVLFCRTPTTLRYFGT